MGKERIRTSIEEIVDYWFSIVDECDLSVDASEAHERCWRCGCEKSLERCHIIPEPLGGGDKPSNLVLLCHRCHLENPNVSDPEIMWDWLRADGTSFYDTFWTSVSNKATMAGMFRMALKKYEEMYTSAEMDI